MQAQGGRVVLDYETNFGEAPASKTGIIMPISSLGLKSARTSIKSSAVNQSRNPRKSTRGRLKVDGPSKIPLGYLSLGYWLKGLFGAPDTTGGIAAGYVTGAIGVDDTIGTWNAITDGSFSVSINGVAHDITGLDFSLDGTMSAVAARIQAAIRAIATGGFTLATVTYSAPTKYFRVTSGTTGSSSSVSVLAAAASGTNISVTMKCRTADSAVVTAGTGAYIHVFKIVTGRAIPSLVLAKEFADINQYFLALGCRPGSFKTSFGDDAEVVADMDIYARDESYSGTEYDSSATELIDEPLSPDQISVKEGGTVIEVVSKGTIDINANLDLENFTTASGLKRRNIPYGRFAINGSIEALFEDDSLLAKIAAGTPSSLEVIYTKSADMSVSFYQPELTFEVTSPPIDGPGGVKLNTNYETYQQLDAGNSAIIVTLKNSIATF